MRKLPLTQGKFAIIDNSDFDYLNQWKWSFDRSIGYAVRTEKSHKIYLHRLLMNPQERKQVDHINGRKLDNRRNNLRNVTHTQNTHNKHKILSNTNRLNIHFHKKHKRFDVSIMRNGKHIYRARFATLRQAVIARNLFLKQVVYT